MVSNATDICFHITLFCFKELVYLVCDHREIVSSTIHFASSTIKFVSYLTIKYLVSNVQQHVYIYILENLLLLEVQRVSIKIKKIWMLPLTFTDSNVLNGARAEAAEA
jgi:hypothetical protein